jgi:hypothetical protein
MEEEKERRGVRLKPGLAAAFENSMPRLVFWLAQGCREMCELLMRCWHRGRLRCSLVLFIFVLLFRNVSYTIGYLNKRFSYRTWVDRYRRYAELD